MGAHAVAVTEDEGVSLAITHIEDVTEQRRTAERLQWAATHDDLTGLPNRTELIAHVDAILADAAVGDVALLFIDLDNFKAVNDSLGHGIGDTLLSTMSVRLREVVGPDAELARFGGDEFIVVLRHAGRDPLAVAEDLRAAVRNAVDVEGTELFVSTSIGVSVNDREGVTADDLLRDADAAMYRAKARGRDCVEAFAPGTHETTVLALRTATELRRGLERGEIVPYFQPIVELTTGHVTGFEALARWLHPERGLLAPDQFLPMAEETGLIDEIGATILEDALAQFARWRARDLPFADATLAVNVGTRQVVDPAFAGLVADLLGQTGIPADSLWLEITETALLADVKASTVALRNLRSLGLHLAVDDFGTGYSSLTYLKRFPVEAIKIDRGFVAGLGLDTEDTTIVEAVVNLGHSFGIAVVAEGLETPLQLSLLREMGCDRGQGYLFGRPRPASIVEAEPRRTLTPVRSGAVMRRITAAPAALLLASLLGGCGDDDDGGDIEPTAPATIAVGGVLEAFPDPPATEPTEPAPATTDRVERATTTTSSSTTSTTVAPPLTSFAADLTDLVAGTPAGIAGPSDRLVDDTGRLSLDVPVAWAERDTAAGPLADGAVAPHAAASPDLRRFLDGYDAPGLTVVVLPGAGELADELDQYRFDDDCQPSAAVPYVGSDTEGEYRVWRDCGGTGTDIVTVVADAGAETVLVLAQIREHADLVALDTALDTLTVRR